MPPPLAGCCSTGGSQGPVPRGLEQPCLPGQSAPRLLGCWLHPSCGPLTRPVGISSPSHGEKEKNFCDLCLVSPTGRVSEFRRDLRASHPGTWADVLCPETPPRRGSFRQRRPCRLLPETGSIQFSEGRGGRGVMRGPCAGGRRPWSAPARPHPCGGSWAQRSPPSPATEPLLQHGGPRALVSGMPAEKGGRKLRRRAQQGPGSVSASAHRSPCAPSTVRGRARG